jgi:hypothetical protein
MDSEDIVEINEMPKQTGTANKFLNILWLIPIVVLGYIAWMNFMPLGHMSTYFINVGGEDMVGTARITGPFDRISDRIETTGVSYRELEKSLVYFELDKLGLSDTSEIGIRVRFQDAFPEDGKFIIGAKNAKEWSYIWKESYVPFYDRVSQLVTLAEDGNIKVYLANNENHSTFTSIDNFRWHPPIGSVIACNDADMKINQRIILPDTSKTDIGDDAYQKTPERNTTIISNALRGGHTFWTYVTDGSLELEVTKQDLNWYEKPDDLVIEVYSLGDELKGNTSIPDDGDAGNTKKLGSMQIGVLNIEGLEPGSYRIELKSNSDLLIREIKINQTKLVLDKKIFLAGMNPVYLEEGLKFDPVTLYCENFRRGEVKFYTFHEAGLQQITINGDGFDSIVDINEIDTDFIISLNKGVYQMTVPRQNIIIESSNYLSFTPESYFLPKRCEVIELKCDLSWNLDNVDYILINTKDYVPPTIDDSWLIAQSSWDTESLFIDDNKLSFCFKIPHLESESGKSIPVDWIEIKVKSLPIWEGVD